MKYVIILPAIVLTPVLTSAQTTNPSTNTTKVWSSTAGIATVAMPGYLGSNRYRVRTVPILQLEFKERAYLGSSTSGIGGGLGVYMLRKSNLSWSAELSSAGKRRESYGDGLAGMGSRDGGTFVGTNASYHAGGTTFGAGVATGLGKQEGTTASFSTDTKKRFGNRWIADVSTGATFSDKENMSFDFGITPTQSIRRQALIASGDSRLSAHEGSAYDPKGGLKQAQVSTSLGFLISKRTTALAFATGTRLGSEPSDSPLVRKRNGVMAGLGFAVGL
jgi:outer membrane scaffolding protein for murein synthesis (MipA/OmpV family)